jgi:hypothetical protein
MQGGELEVVVSGAKRGVGEEIVLYVEREDGRRFEDRNERNEGRPNTVPRSVRSYVHSGNARQKEGYTPILYCLPP